MLITRRDGLLADIKWGMREGMILTGIMFIPALIIVALTKRTPVAGFWQVLVLYVVFGAGGGAMVGLVRPWISRVVVVSLVGALIGAIGFVLIVCVPREGQPFPGIDVAIFSAVLGALTGGITAAGAWKRNAERQESKERREE